MRLLLDTNVFLWWGAASPRLNVQLRETISGGSRVFVSAVSAAEIGVKISVGKLRIPEPVAVGIRNAGFEALPFTIEHAELLPDLPLHHRDPFDRMLIAQAHAEGLTVVTADALFRTYGLPVIGA